MSIQTSSKGSLEKPNPKAPRELSQFAFLVGEWRLTGDLKTAEGSWEEFHASMTGRFILDGYAIADEYRQFGPDGELVHFGATYRSYNTERSAWVMKFHDALRSTWLDLGPEELGGVHVDATHITFKHELPPDGLLQVTFSNISDEHFSWRADRSLDGGASWENVMKMEAHRVHRL